MRRLTIWDISYLILLVLAIPILVKNVIDGRYGQVFLTVIFLGAGLALLAYSWRSGQSLGPEVFVVERPARRMPRPERVTQRGRAGRLVNWPSESIISGFAATGVLTVSLVFAFGIARVLGSDAAGANQVEQWLWALTHNPITEQASSNIAIALVLHFLSGIVWAVVYAALVEPRLSGPGWLKGIIFSILPWILSLVVFLPAANGGLFGMDLEAGPLPTVGNLILHLAYGATLGLVYGSQRVLVEEGERVAESERRALAHSQRDLALGLVPGIILGGLIGLLGASLFAPGQEAWVVAAFGAIAGSVVGVLIGSLVGLGPGPEQRREETP